MDVKLIISKDGSHTLYRKDIDETYHSRHGAIQEAQHVFIDMGLKEVEKSKKEINILEVGFGTGLNALLTCLNSTSKINYIGLESFPLQDKVLGGLNYDTTVIGNNSQEIFNSIHDAPWETQSPITSLFSINKIENEIQKFEIPQSIDLVYYDAFGPNSQAEMWDISIFEKLYKAMSSSGVFVTYCAKGQVRRDLKSVGFTMERLEGPPGKREMLRGRKL
jgi:tRNA U34 5-methylaminomethyl-2-thiouridine-forming methyltransferase MnmC